MAKLLSIRGVDERVAQDFAAGAHARGITQAEYLRRLLLLRHNVDAAFSWESRDPEKALYEVGQVMARLGMFNEVV